MGVIRLVDDVGDADLVLEDPTAAPTKLWREIASTPVIEEATEHAARTLLDGVDRAEATAALLEAGVDDERFAQLVSDAAKKERSDSEGTWSGLHDVVRSPATNPAPDGGVDSILDGPVSLFASSGVEPMLSVDLGEAFMRQAPKRRGGLLRFLTDLSIGFTVRLVCGPVICRVLAEQHADDLPASAVNEAREQGRIGRTGGTAPTPVDDVVNDALDSLSWDDPAWRVLQTIREEPREERPYTALYADVRLNGVSKSGIRKQLARLADAGLLERTREGETSIARLTQAGVEASQQRAVDVGDDGPENVRDSDARVLDGGSGGCGGTRDTPDSSEGTDADSSGGVNDPPKSSAEAVFSPGEDGRPPSDRSVPDRAPGTTYLPRRRHDATVAAVEAGDVALLDAPVDRKPHPGDRWVSFDEGREEIVVEVEAHHSRTASTAVRLAAALTSNELLYHAVDLPARIDDGGPMEGFDVNRVVLRKGHCLGYLPDSITSGLEYSDRLREERQQLLSEAGKLVGSDGDYRPDIAASVLPDAVGLASTMIRIYELLGLEVVVNLTVPDWNRNLNPEKEERRASFRKLLSYLTTINATHGVYPMYRKLFEQREEKREDSLSGPAVDPTDPTGELLGSWVLTGPGISDFAEDLEYLAGWDVHVDAIENEREFAVDLDVVQGWSRQVAIRAANRVLERKNLQLSSRATDALLALLDSPYSVTTALDRLGREPLNEERQLYLDEIRWTVSTLDVEEIVPNAGIAVQKIVSTLLSTSSPLSTAELADRADVSEATIRTHRDRLQALGLLVLEEQGAGQATLHRISLPGRDERADEEASTFGLDEDLNNVSHYVEEVLNRLGESVAVSHPSLWDRLWSPGGDDIDEVWSIEGWGWLRRWGDYLAALAGEEIGGKHSWADGPISDVVELGQRPSKPASQQSTLEQALGLAAAD